MTVETCDECRFDSTQYTTTDARRSLVSMAIRWRWAVDGIDQSVLATRPAPSIWSPTEYAHHAADVLMSLNELLALVVAGDLPPMEVPRAPDASPDDPPPRSTAAKGIDRLQKHALRLETAFGALGKDGRAASDELGGETIDAGWILRHAVHDSSHHLMDVGRVLHALGHGAPRAEGRVAGVFASGGGVPKQPVETATVGYRGVDGDKQSARQHHGRVWQALCLWSTEVIVRLRDEGHPIAPGRAGENVAVSGIDWSTLRVGTRVAIGDVLAEVSAYAAPCKKNAAWFVAGDFGRMSHDREPGVSRVYASVLRDGVIHTGDAVVVEPDLSG